MKWYKLNLINKAVFVIAFAILIFILFGSKGPWDLYFYIFCGAILFIVLLIDAVVQAIKDDNRTKK
ncbi:hypothetical protein CLV33_1222 [Jejuia pallidilutea]|uniref:Uncharacterized protein n=1 Tax=Jejuia pallidilutea TaxID=504487 RepID=A0A362X4I2_9FLAO|nr:hypothetical protein CLV33_1222 [Jejuia pallidilutea]